MLSIASFSKQDLVLINHAAWVASTTTSDKNTGFLEQGFSQSQGKSIRIINKSTIQMLQKELKVYLYRLQVVQNFWTGRLWCLSGNVWITPLSLPQNTLISWKNYGSATSLSFISLLGEIKNSWAWMRLSEFVDLVCHHKADWTIFSSAIHPISRPPLQG